MRVTDQEYQVLLRNDFVTFIHRAFQELNPGDDYKHNWHIDAIAAALEQCRAGEMQRLLITLPPRNLKSSIVSMAFPAWLLGHNPTEQIICASYAQDLADKLAYDCRSIIITNWYQSAFPSTRLGTRKQAVHDFTTTEKGFRMATSVGGVLTGRGGNILIIDDPLKPSEALSEAERKRVNDWYDHTLYSRLNDKRTGCIIVVMQRLHEDDLVGHLLAQGGWTSLKFPAIAEEDETHIFRTIRGQETFTRRSGDPLHPEREPIEVLRELRESLGEYHFAGQYQQAPAPLGGGLIKTSWFRLYTSEELPKEFDLIFQSWDTANKSSELNDYSVCTTWGVHKSQLYLRHVLRKRLDYPELRRTAKLHAAMYGANNILIEDQGSGTQLIQDLQRDGVHGTTPYRPKVKMDKFTRMYSVSSTIESGFVHIPAQADWLAEYLHEMAIFPKGRFDDQVDSTSQALDWVKDLSTQWDSAWFRLLARRNLVEQGRWDDIREMDAKYGPPPGEPTPPPQALGPAIHAPKSPQPSGTAVYTLIEEVRLAKRSEIF